MSVCSVSLLWKYARNSTLLKNMLRKGYKALLLISLLATVAVAQDSRKPDSLFDRGFVTRSDNKNKPVVSKPRRDRDSQQEGQRTVTPKVQRSDSVLPERKDKTPSVTELAEGIPIDWVGLIVNGIDEEHYVKTLNELFETVTDRKLGVGHVYTIGGFIKPDIEKIKLKLMVRGGGFQQDTLPDKYSKGTQSPTWIVATSDGEYLLEGLGPLKRYISTNGKFIERPMAIGR